MNSPAIAKETAPTIAIQSSKSFPHDAGAFTQGFEICPDNPQHYYESTGHYGRSTLRRVDLNSGKIVQTRSLDQRHFGEGLTQVGDHLIQLTWRAGQALRYDARTFTPLAPWNYKGEGWGICFDGKTLWMSDGSATLTARNPADFAVLRTIKVRYNGQDLSQLNELECARGQLYANVWHQDWVAEIDPGSGNVTRRIDASSLRTQAGPYAGTLNGIAYRSETGTFFLTGKNWSKIFEVEIALSKDSAPNSGDLGQQAPGKVQSTKRRGCAFFSTGRNDAIGFLLSLGVVCCSAGRRRRTRITAKCASNDHA